VECLVEQGVTHAFGVPGESYLAVLDGFHQHADRIRFITNRQEGGAAFMAETHGKLTGRPGVCLVTRGPGATNASIGVHTAFQDSTPMLLLVGDVASDCRDREAFQEVNYFSFFGPLAKRVERIDDASRIPEYIARAFATAMNGRPGPVVLVLPEDMLTQTVAARPLPRVEPAQAWSDPGALRTLRQLLLQAQRPLVLAGGGGWTPQAAQALQRFAENWQLPVANTFRFQDTFDNHHPLYAGDVGLGINPVLAASVRQSDLVIAIGPRLGEATTGGYTLLQAPTPAQKLVHIHASAEELNRVYQPTLAICATMNAAARSLEVLTAPPSLPWADWAATCHRNYLANIDEANGGIKLPGTRRCGTDQRRGQLCQLAAPLLPLPRAGQGPQNPAGSHQRGDGLWRARRGGCGHHPARARGIHHCRRWRLTDERPGAGYRQPARGQDHRAAGQQRGLRHHPHAPGARVPAARQRFGPQQPRFLCPGQGLWLRGRAHHHHG
jgi:acetolactate synthase-1/2/3 large subunit